MLFRSISTLFAFIFLKANQVESFYVTFAIPITLQFLCHTFRDLLLV